MSEGPLGTLNNCNLNTVKMAGGDADHKNNLTS